MTALEVKEDGQIWLIPDMPEKPRACSSFVPPNHCHFPDELTCGCGKEYWQYTETIANQSILISNQDVALDLLWRNDERIHNPVPFLYWKENMLKPGIYPIPDLKWEVKENYYGGIANWYKVAVIIQEDEPFNGCSPTACGCKSLADCPNNQPLAVVTFVKKEDEKNGMYEEPKKPLRRSKHWQNVIMYILTMEQIEIDAATPEEKLEINDQKWRWLQQHYKLTKRNPQVK